MFKRVSGFLHAVFGKINVSYTPPRWLSRKSKPEGRAVDPRRRGLKSFFNLSGPRSWIAYGLLLFLAFSVAFGVVSARQASAVGFKLSAPGLRGPDADTPPPLRLTFSAAAAKMDLIGKAVETGVALTPSLRGRWVWMSDQELVFFPSEDWPVGVDYRIALDKSIFSDQVKLQRLSASFSTPRFEAKITASELYINPTATDEVRARVSLSFTYPVNREAFKAAVRSKENCTVEFDDSGLGAYIVSAPLAVRDKAYEVKISVRGGYGPAAVGPAFKTNLDAAIAVPGRYDKARIEEAEASMLRTESYEYRRVLAFTASMGIKPEALAAGLSVYLLPKDRPASPGVKEEKDHEWGVEEIDRAVLAASEKLKLEPVPIEGSFGTQLSFFFEAPSKRLIYVRAAKDLSFAGAFRSKDTYETVIQLEPIPKEVQVMYEGSILSMSGERTVSLYANDIENVQFEIGRIIPDQVNHFVTQTYGEYSRPDFEHSDFGVENISSMYQETRRLRSLEPGKVQYFSFDFNRYLARESDPRMRYGLFYLKVSEYDPEKKEATDVSSRRFVLVTDLGILVKKNSQVGYDLFVQSVHSGAPVSGASVEVVGKNGLPIVKADTDSSGHAFIPSLDGFVREKAPAVFVVKKGADMSFIPVAGEGRFLNYSRFDTGGLHGASDPGFIDAYLFSDRGIYRPGEEARVGVIVKAGSWDKKLSGIPLEICVEDTRGVEIKRQPLTLSASGFEEFSWRSLESSPTGKYGIKLYLLRDKDEKRLLGSTSIKVEEFRPDRLSIRAKIAEDSGKAWIPLKDIHAEVTLMNLYGTPAAGNAVSGRVFLTPASPRLKGFDGFVFSDPYTTTKTFEDSLGGLSTDDAGRVVFPVDLSRFDKATFLLRVAVEGKEKEGGRGVMTDTAVLVSPLSAIVGYKADGDLSYVGREAARSVRFIAVSAESKQVPLQDAVLKIEESRFVSVLEKGADKLFHYRSVEKKIPVLEKAFPISAVGTDLVLPTQAAGSFIVSLTDASGTVLSKFAYSVAGTGNLARSLDKNAELQIKLDRADYAPGQRININVVAPYVGAGLITIERDKVYAWSWFKADTNASVQSIIVPEGLDGTAYVNVSFLRSIDSREIYASPLSYGVAPFSISRERRTNRVELTVPEELPGASTLKVGYRTAKPGKIVVFGVDEGILQVAKYKSPKPLDHFFRKRALEVDSLQILDLVLPEYSIIRAVSAMGGDDDGLGRNINPFKKKNKPPVVFWSGILPCDSTQRTYEYQIPDWFNGTVRVFAVAVSDDSIGTAERSAVVRNEFVVTPNVPVTLGPGDEFEVGVSVMNDSKAAPATDVSLSVEASAHFQVLGEKIVKAGLKKGEEKTWFFRLKALDKLGEGRLRFIASGGADASGKSVSCAVEETVSLRPAMPFRSVMRSGRVRNGAAETPLARKMHEDFRSLDAVVSYLPTGMTVGLRGYLDKFPYGCTEQIVSRAFPAIALKDAPDIGLSGKEAMEAFLYAQSVLASRQAEDGRFGLWSARGDGPSFVTPYAMHFLTEALDAGFPVDQGLMASGMEALAALASGGAGGRYADTRSAAYAIYVLTRNGVVTTTKINALLGSKSLPRDWRKGSEGAYLAGAYALLKKDAEAKSLLNSAFAGRRSDFDEYYGDLSATSLCLYLASRHVPDLASSFAAAALDSMAASIGEGKFNTLSSSYTVLALGAYARAAALGGGEKPRVEVKDAAGAWKPLEAKGEAVLRASIPYGSVSARFSDKTGKSLYWQVTESGFDTTPPSAPERHGLEILREYTDASGKALKSLPLGEEVFVHLKIRTTDKGRKKLENVAVVDLFPSGFELAGVGSPFDPVGSGSLDTKFVEPREDRVLVFCTAEESAKDFVYKLKPTVSGRFALAPLFAESMYDRSIWSLVPVADGITVVAPLK